MKQSSKEQLDGLLEQYKAQPVGNGYIDIIVMKNIALSLIGAVLAFVLGGCNKMLPFKPETYRAVEDVEVLKLTSRTDAEFTEQGRFHYIGKYSSERERIRLVLNVAGSEQAFYFQITPEGLKQEGGRVLYEPKKYEAVMKDVMAKRHQAKLNDSLRAAAEKGDDKAIVDLIKQGAQVDAANPADTPALGKAVYKCHSTAVEALLNH